MPAIARTLPRPDAAPTVLALMPVALLASVEPVWATAAFAVAGLVISLCPVRR